MSISNNDLCSRWLHLFFVFRTHPKYALIYAFQDFTTLRIVDSATNSFEDKD